MKLLEKIIAVSSFLVGSSCFTFAVSNLEFSEYTDSPLFSWKLLIVMGLIAYIPLIIWIIRKETHCQDNH